MWTCKICNTKNEDKDQFCACCGEKRQDHSAPGQRSAPDSRFVSAIDVSNEIHNVILVEIGKNKIKLINTVRGITGLGLADAKNLVESVPGAIIKAGVFYNEAMQIKNALESDGGTVEID